MTQPELIAEALALRDYIRDAEDRAQQALRAALRAKERLRDQEASYRLDESLCNARTEAQREAQVRLLTNSQRAELALAEEEAEKAKIDLRHWVRRHELLVAILTGGYKG